MWSEPWRVNAEVAADFAERRRKSIGIDVLVDEIQDCLLALGNMPNSIPNMVR
jgi:hypothetical protein